MPRGRRNAVAAEAVDDEPEGAAFQVIILVSDGHDVGFEGR